MKIIPFGNTGLKVSKVCFGTMTIGSNRWKPWVLNKSDSRPILKKCLELGINFFDTANWYSTGESEKIVSSILMSLVPRDQLILATKVYYPMSDDPNQRGLSKKHILSSIDSSLKRMNTDYIDLFIIHAFDTNTPIEETMETLDHLVRIGKVRYLGASTMYAWQFESMNHIARLNGWTEFKNMQCQYNLIYREEEREMIPYCTNRKIATTAFSPLARGWLSGSNKVRSETDESFKSFHGDNLDKKIINLVKNIASNYDVTMANIALSWLNAKSFICCVSVSKYICA